MIHSACREAIDILQPLIGSQHNHNGRQGSEHAWCSCRLPWCSIQGQAAQQARCRPACKPEAVWGVPRTENFLGTSFRVASIFAMVTFLLFANAWPTCTQHSNDSHAGRATPGASQAVAAQCHRELLCVPPSRGRVADAGSAAGAMGAYAELMTDAAGGRHSQLGWQARAAPSRRWEPAACSGRTTQRRTR